jgi:hypothetical protein
MTTTLRGIFKKPVDREIEGVIKADDDASLRIELEEYIITNEIEKQLERFLDAYNNSETSNGVWISGFFGSGKSHLLKMLALLLENRQVEGIPAYDFFKGKCLDNQILSAELRRAIAIPSKSILFNIDQKADVISKEQIDALLSVFQKVFDEMCGYYGKQPHIAQFERDLDGRGLLKQFKVAFSDLAEMPWERGREQYILEGANITKAYAAATGLAAAEGQGVLNRYRQDFRSSIEDFAEKVKQFIDDQEPGFRLNFFVDEVGQYIADNVKLMTNLQTIAESLNTKCRGRAWIIVTAQQDMSSVIGDLDQQKQNDFSKIQARFANRMPLNSADVAEVIQRRLLEKTDASFPVLSDLYHHEANNLKTLFDFSDGSIRLENFRDKEHFIRSYPFVPYQYALFQMAIQNLSQHSAFEGKHSSVGERSMLGVFQDVAKRVANLPVGTLATFDFMFEGIRTALKSNVQQSILVAEANLGDKFSTQILKALFLVKYVKPFKASARNVAILMLDRFDVDLTVHRRRVEEALSLLEQNTYIQRNGELFEFLTDEEKDIEQEIKATEVDPSEVTKELETLLFDNVIKSRKLRHEASSNDYSYSRRLDDRLLGREYELSINLVTPFHEHSGAPDSIRLATMSKDELAVVLKADARFISDVMMYKRTDKYVRHARQTTQQPTIDRIIRDKGELNNSRQRDLTRDAKLLLADSRLFVRGEEIEIRAEDPQVRIDRAFQVLVDKVYINLPMLRGVVYAEAEISNFLRKAADGLLGESNASLTEAEQEILNFAQANARTGVRTTVKAITERFERAPYGWSYAAILCTTAALIGRGKMEARMDGSSLEGDALERGLKNAHALTNIVLDLQVEFTSGQVRKLREFYVAFFDAQPASSDGKALGLETIEHLKTARTELESLTQQSARYPFLTAVEPVLEQLKSVMGKPYAWYLTEMGGHTDTLLDAKEALLDPMRRFLAGPQKVIHDEARSYLFDQRENFGYCGTDKAALVKAAMADPNSFKGRAIQDLKAQLDALKAEIDVFVVRERESALGDIAELHGKLTSLPEFSSLPASSQRAIEAEIGEATTAIRQATLIAVIRERAASFRSQRYPALLTRITAPAAKPKPTSRPEPLKPTQEQTRGFEDNQRPIPEPPPKPEPPEPPAPEYVAASTLRAPYAEPFLTTEEDVDAYLKTLREAYVRAIQTGKRISV